MRKSSIFAHFKNTIYPWIKTVTFPQTDKIYTPVRDFLNVKITEKFHIRCLPYFSSFF